MTVNTVDIHAAGPGIGPGFAGVPAPLVGYRIAVGRIRLGSGILGRYVGSGVFAPWGCCGIAEFGANAGCIPGILFWRLAIAKRLRCGVLVVVAGEAVAVQFR